MATSCWSWMSVGEVERWREGGRGQPGSFLQTFTVARHTLSGWGPFHTKVWLLLVCRRCFWDRSQFRFRRSYPYPSPLASTRDGSALFSLCPLTFQMSGTLSGNSTPSDTALRVTETRKPPHHYTCGGTAKMYNNMANVGRTIIGSSCLAWSILPPSVHKYDVCSRLKVY